MSTVYLVASIHIGSHRLFWFDELATIRFARLPDALAIWKAAGTLDPWGMPAPYYILVHAFQSGLGATEMAARLPSALAVAAGLLVTFDCTRRLTDGWHGLIAVGVLMCSFLPLFAFEARSYGLCFLFAALSLWVWAHSGDSRRSAVLFGAVFFCALLMHPYSVFCFLPYVAREILRGKIFSRKVVGAIAGMGCAAALLASHISSGLGKAGVFPGPHPTLAALEGVFQEMFPDGLLLIVCIMLWISIAGASAENTKAAAVLPMESTERVGWFFLLIPLAGFVIAELITHAFGTRYFIATLPGVAVASACLLWRNFREYRIIGIGVVALLVCAGAVRELRLAWHPESIEWPYGQQARIRQMLSLENSLRRDGKQFILISGNFLYYEAQYYSRQPDLYRYLEPDDPVYAIPDYFANYYSLKTWKLSDIKEHARQTAVINPLPDTLSGMKQAGFETKTRFTDPLVVVYFQ